MNYSTPKIELYRISSQDAIMLSADTAKGTDNEIGYDDIMGQELEVK